MDISKQIKYLRERNGMTQTQLAKMLGISRSAVNSWEMGSSLPSIPNIIEMTRIFSVSADSILSLSERIQIDVTELTEAEREIIFRMVECLKNKQ